MRLRDKAAWLGKWDRRNNWGRWLVYICVVFAQVRCYSQSGVKVSAVHKLLRFGEMSSVVSPRLQQFVPNEFHAIGLLNLVSKPVLVLQNTCNLYRLTGVHHFILSGLSNGHIAILRVVSEKERFPEMAFLRRSPYWLEVWEGHALSHKRESDINRSGPTRDIVEIHCNVFIEDHWSEGNQGTLGRDNLRTLQIGRISSSNGGDLSSLGGGLHFRKLAFHGAELKPSDYRISYRGDHHHDGAHNIRLRVSTALFESLPPVHRIFSS